MFHPKNSWGETSTGERYGESSQVVEQVGGDGPDMFWLFSKSKDWSIFSMNTIHAAWLVWRMVLCLKVGLAHCLEGVCVCKNSGTIC